MATKTKKSTSGYGGAQYAAMSKKAATPSVASSAAIADRRSTANIAPVQTLPASQLQRITTLPAVQQIPSQPPAPPAADAGLTNWTDIGYAGTDAGLDAGTAAPEPAPKPAPVLPARPTEEALAANALLTPEYIARKKALDDALALYSGEQDISQQRYDVDYGNALRDLGWRSDKNDWDAGELATEQAKQTASGRAFTSQLNDFASRGLLQSGAFRAASAQLKNQLAEQKASMERSKAQFGEDVTKKKQTYASEQEPTRLQALSDAKQSLLNAWSEEVARLTAGA